MSRAWLSLGSNIEPERHLRAAVAALAARFGSPVLSPVYRTAAVGFDGPAFLNAAAGIDTGLDPVALNDWLHALEERLGRDRSGPRWSSRTADVDIVLYDQQVLDGPGNLKLPRPELDQGFVLAPLADIAADVVVPGTGQTVAALWQRHPEHGRLKPLPGFDWTQE